MRRALKIPLNLIQIEFPDVLWNCAMGAISQIFLCELPLVIFPE